MEKNPEQRFQSARDLSFALSALSGTDASGVARAVAAPRKVPLLLWLSVALVLLAVTGVTWFVARRPVSTTRLQFALAVPEEMSVSHMALSRDGTLLVFVSPDENSALPMLFVQRVGSPNVSPLPGTQGASYPFWSPDGANVGFFANGKLQKIAVSGGTPQALASVLAGRGGSWGTRDVIIYSPDAASAVWRVNADGSGAAAVTQDSLNDSQGLQTHRWPVFLPDGNHFLMWAGNFGNMKEDSTSGIYVSSLDGKGKRLVILCHSSFGYDSHHLYYADDQRQLVSVEFDPSSARVSGRTAAIANVVGYQPATYWAAVAAGGNGTVIYNTGVGAALSVLTWMDRSGKQLGLIGDPAIIANPTLSPEGNRVAVDISDVKGSSVDVWLLSTNGAGNSRFTFDPVEQVVGVWSRDGRTLAYRAVYEEGPTLFTKPASGLEREKPLLRSPAEDDFLPNSWSPDGHQILCTNQASPHTYLASSAGRWRATHSIAEHQGQPE